MSKRYGYIVMLTIEHAESGRKWGMMSSKEGKGEHRIMTIPSAVGGLMRAGLIEPSETDDLFNLTVMETSVDDHYYRHNIRPVFENVVWPIEGSNIVHLDTASGDS